MQYSGYTSAAASVPYRPKRMVQPPGGNGVMLVGEFADHTASTSKPCKLIHTQNQALWNLPWKQQGESVPTT